MPDQPAPPVVHPEPAPAEHLGTQQVLAAMGGARGLFDSAVPATVFVLVRVVSHTLSAALVAALLAGAALLGLRLARRQPLQQVASGFFGLLVAVLVARATGTGKGFFLPGIVTTALSGVLFLGSVLVGRPLVAVALTAYDTRYAGWRDHRPLRRACVISTSAWAVTFFIRAGVAASVYRLHGDHDALLLIVINAVKWPLILAAAGLTVVLVRRSGYALEPDPGPAPDWGR